MKHILYIEDDHEIGEWVKNDLRDRGYEVTWLTDGQDVHHYIQRVDLVILDVMLPGLDGFTVGQRLKEKAPDVPILMLSARTAIEDKVEGLTFADDYVTKPFHPEELAARVEVLLRRFASTDVQPVRLQHLDVYLSQNRVVNRETGEEVTLTGKEHRLLTYFLRHPNQVLTKEQLYEAVWGEMFAGGDNTIMVHIRHLREKLERDPSRPTVIETIRGLGYRVRL